MSFEHEHPIMIPPELYDRAKGDGVDVDGMGFLPDALDHQHASHEDVARAAVWSDDDLENWEPTGASLDIEDWGPRDYPGMHHDVNMLQGMIGGIFFTGLGVYFGLRWWFGW